MTSSTTPTSRFRGNAQLHQFLFWAALAAVAAIIAFLIGGIVFASTPLVILAGGGVVLLALELVAMWLNQRGKVTVSAYVVCSAVAGYALLIVLVAPDFLPVLMLGPVIILTIVQPLLDQIALRVISVSMALLAIVITALGGYVRLFEPMPDAILNPLLIILVALSMPMLLILMWQNYNRVTSALQQSEQSNRALQAIRDHLEEEVARRTSDLQQALHSLEQQFAEQRSLRLTLEQQQEAIRELSVPILPVTNDILVMPLIGVVDRERLGDINRRALTAIAESGAQKLLIDITGVPVVDKEVANGLITVFQAVRLLGGQVYLAGVRPEVAQALVAINIDLQGIQTFATLQDALARALPAAKVRAV
ncbi:MAG: STAS domain-containing protein [Chloroflexus sp.]|nr:STAS domain-containing protein [Chloroflexus sp.]